jgi:hypothetical protein
MHLHSAVEYHKINVCHVRFEVFTAVTMKNGIFWDVVPCELVASYGERCS